MPMCHAAAAVEQHYAGSSGGGFVRSSELSWSEGVVGGRGERGRLAQREENVIHGVGEKFGAIGVA